MPVLEIRADGYFIDKKPFRLIGGAIHYFRTSPEMWRDRLVKLCALGCNTVETYVAWNAHEAYPGRFSFDGILDLVAFCRIAEELGLYVIVRPGPYICAEWDFGGLPGWLLADADMRIRCAHKPYLDKVDRWFEQLLPRLTPLLGTRGGPIIAMQIENEYGYFGNDAKYLTHLRDTMVRLGVDVPLFTSDGAFERLTIASGGLDGHLRTANFGSDGPARIAALREFQPTGPMTCMEFWVGWFDTWGDAAHHSRSAPDAAHHLDQLLSTGASVNIYMFHGGTNFGLTAGGNLSDTFKPYVTSYDYDSLLTESGDITQKFELCRDVIHKHLQRAVESTPLPSSTKRGFGKQKLARICSVASLAAGEKSVESVTPLSIEQLGHSNGFVLYRTTLPEIYRNHRLVIRGMHDWCNVMLDGKSIATWYRNDPMPEMRLDFAGRQGVLEILVHNMARANFGHRTAERKGITEGVFVGPPSRHDERALFGWEQVAMPMVVAPKPQPSDIGPGTAAGLFEGTFHVDQVADTYVRLDGFGLGCVFINGRNLGRYWKIGPQKALYLPASWLRVGPNEICVFEADRCDDPTVEFVDQPVLG